MIASDFLAQQVISRAEPELFAFISAVTELYGSGQAKLSADDWLDELNSMESLPASTTRGWRMVTISAAARLANRITGPVSKNPCVRSAPLA
jgi:hypothetical protein